MIRYTALAGAAVLALAGCSSSGGGSSPGGPAGGSVTVAIENGNLIAPDGHTLYANTADSPHHLVCTGQCLKAWPPLYGDPQPGSGIPASALGTVKRGSKTQITFRGHPLYEFASDTGPGTTKGDGVSDAGGTWHSLGSSVGVVGTAPAPSTGHEPAGRAKSGGGGYP